MTASAQLSALLATLCDAPWVTDAVAELHDAGHASLAAQLRAVLGPAAGAEACESVVGELWRHAQARRAAAAARRARTLTRRAPAQEGVGWTAPFWRECYVLSCVAAAAACCDDAPSAAAAALRHLDMAFIMGGPPDVLQPFVAVVEPLVPRAAAAAPDDASPLPRSLLQADAPTLQPGMELRRLDAADWGCFRKEYYNIDAPVVLAGLAGACARACHRAARSSRDARAAEWPAVDKWRQLSFWETEFGHRCVPLEVGSHTDGSWHEAVVSVREFVAALRADERVVYLAQHPLFEQLPALREDFVVPDCVGRRLSRINAWLGSRGTRTPLHYDSYDGALRGHVAAWQRAPRRGGDAPLLRAGLLTQAVGYKYVRLYPASNTPFLYRSTAPWASQRRWPSAEAEEAAPSGGAPQGTISLVDVEQPDLQRFPLFAQARFLETVLGPGDALFIPAGCWHFVKSLSVSASVSFVF